MSYKDPWLEFLLEAPKIQIHSSVGRLLSQGSMGLELIKQIAQIQKNDLSREELARFYLPWYYHLDWGYTEWYRDGAIPLTISSWIDNLNDGSPPAKDQVLKLADLEFSNLYQMGPVIVAEDSSIGVSVIVEGCKRACAYSLTNQLAPVLTLSGPFVSLMFPSDFFPHALRKSSWIQIAKVIESQNA